MPSIRARQGGSHARIPRGNTWLFSSSATREVIGPAVSRPCGACIIVILTCDCNLQTCDLRVYASRIIMADESDDSEDAAGLSAFLNRNGILVRRSTLRMASFMSISSGSPTTPYPCLNSEAPFQSDQLLHLEWPSKLTRTYSIYYHPGTRTRHSSYVLWSTLADYQRWFHD